MMKNDENFLNENSRDKLISELQKELDRLGLKDFLQQNRELNRENKRQLNKLQLKIKNLVFEEIGKEVVKRKTHVRDTLTKAKEIILSLEIVPFQFATRSTPVEELGKPWVHDGGRVTFKLQTIHDKLEIYSPKGEFLCSYPVLPGGEIKIDDLDAGVYVLYLRGRKIANMEVGGSQKN
ncbi:MAG: hypothetical protein ACOY90_02565 [Candidatus Zhuqueibacterota bacterium]